MSLQASTWWSKRKFSVVALMLSFAEATIMGCAVISVRISKQPPPYIANLTDITWLVGGLTSSGFAVAALIADSDRKAAIVAIIVAVWISSICAIPIMVAA